MFDFLFKHLAKRKNSAAAAPVSKAKTIAPVVVAPVPVPATLRQQALEQAAAVGSDEAAAVRFVIASGVAEARLLAAQAIHGKSSLEQVYKAMRETDRRVAKLMQQRLAALAQEDRTRQRAHDVLAQAQSLCNTPTLLANQVVALAREWQAIATPPAEAAAAFIAAHETLEKRLQAQAALQRRVLDASAQLRAVLADANTTRQTVADALQSADSILATAQQDVELPSLPKQLLPELARLHAQLQLVGNTRAAAEASIAAREAALDAATKLAETEPIASEEIVDAAEPAQEALQAPAPAPERTVAPPIDTEQQREQRAAALEALQAALEEGALQRAMEQDRLLRSLDLAGGRSTPAQHAALTAARAELGRLQGWARWGGNVSREELLASVELLPAQAMANAELARKVGSMRERWRALDASAGPAPRALWLRFDTACTAAYAPVAAYFALLSQERVVNSHKARALIDEVSEFVRAAGLSETLAEGTDWHALTAFSQRVRGLWQRLGSIERKEQKQLEAAFTQALQPLALQLEARQKEALAAREALIAEVAGLSAQARDTPERLQALQARWQQASKAFALPRQHEQACWQRFRAACDAVFTERKTAGAAADAQRHAGLSQKQELCAVLERSLTDATTTDTERVALLRETRASWLAAGPVPRAAQPALQARFDAAVESIEVKRLAVRQALARQQAEAVGMRLALCQEGEQLLRAHDTAAVGALEARWLALPPPTGELEAGLQRRFDALRAAAAADDLAYAQRLHDNQTQRDAALLQLEVDCALESPPAFQRERLALQVAGLQSSFRAATTGNQQSTRARVAALCALPATADTIATQRLTGVVAAMYLASQAVP